MAFQKFQEFFSGPIQLARWLEAKISYLGIREDVLSIHSESKTVNQLHGNRVTDLRLCFRICQIQVFS